MTTELDDDTLDTQVQGLALTGYGALFMRTLLLTVTDAPLARKFVGELATSGLLALGRREWIEDGPGCTVDIGFTFEGLRALGAPGPLLAVLRQRSPAFAEGAPMRAARFLGDAGESAADRWDAVFQSDRAHVWVAIHAETIGNIEAAVAELQRLAGAKGLGGWAGETAMPDGKQMRVGGRKNTNVHFGFRDGITRPSILGSKHRIVQTPPGGKPHMPRPGELLLGYPNNDGADVWITETTPDAVAQFLRNGSFGVLRKIQQYEDRLDRYLEEQAQTLQQAGYTFVTAEYLKAKMCGRWPNGALVAPETCTQPQSPPSNLEQIDFRNDPKGLGCPFGAHIRRANPRTDPLMPPRNRALFRRGIPYGAKGDPEVGLLGVFFCARIEDQFEHLVSQWLEKNPLGPPNRGRAKDPLAGGHDDPHAQFHIPLPDGDRIALSGFTPFVRTRGTLYALFPSRHALQVIAHSPDWRAAAGHANGAAQQQAPQFRQPMDAPKDRFCDVVMEGGITSGVIYASAVVELARHYRFRNIGGSSIGAFAAALTAAAEFRRRQGSGNGFAELAELPEQLARQEGGRTRLERVFMPQRGTRRLFAIFLAALEKGGVLTRVGSGFAAALVQYSWLMGGIFLLLAAVVLAEPIRTAYQCWNASAAAACIAPLLSLTAAVLLVFATGLGLAIGLAWDLGRGVVRNGFGLCRGWDRDARPGSEDLAAFLHASIQQVAGRDPRKDVPLTFRDLWNAPGSAPKALGFLPNGNAWRSINLEVYASNLTHSRPYRFPLEETEDMGRLFFRVEELEDYFPKGLVDYLKAVSLPYAPRSEADPSTDVVGSGYWQLPVADMPIVVAARLAMSFPLLISAVPLHAVEHGAKPRMRRCWMSDGGLCSNFPIHLFDSFLPMWPTFGISLDRRDKNHPDPVSLPAFHTSGRADTWDHGPDTRPWQLFGFLGSLYRTTWRWNDSTMTRMPGVRDRVVHVYLKKDEGGLNIRMGAKRIRDLGKTYGTPAGEKFVEKFLANGGRGWNEHRWVRLNCLLISLRDRIRNFSDAATLARHATPLADALDAALETPPLAKPERRLRYWPSEQKLDRLQVEELRRLVRALGELEAAFQQPEEPEPYRAVPRSSLRIRHPT